jgi:hypothetical protein
MIGNKGARVPGVATDSSKLISVTLAASDILSRWPETDLTSAHILRMADRKSTDPANNQCAIRPIDDLS